MSNKWRCSSEEQENIFSSLLLCFVFYIFATFFLPLIRECNGIIKPINNSETTKNYFIALRVLFKEVFQFEVIHGVNFSAIGFWRTFYFLVDHQRLFHLLRFNIICSVLGQSSLKFFSFTASFKVEYILPAQLQYNLNIEIESSRYIFSEAANDISINRSVQYDF